MKVLFVDDESLVNRMLESRLVREKVNVDFVTDASYALSMVRNNKYDLILLDPMFARISGWKVITEIRNNLRNAATPIIVMSVVSSDRLIADVLASGVKEYITKPFAMDVVVDKLKALYAEQQPSLGETSNPV